MLMVVFGAGATYDSVPSYRPKSSSSTVEEKRPPLANELFENRPLFIEAMSRFPKCLPIVPYLQKQNVEIEQVLEGLQAEAETDSERYRQLAAIRYYLHFMLWECERDWKDVTKGVTNYKTLLDQIRHWREPKKERVCLVTFNYDRMLEEVLPTVGVNIRGLPDYIASDDYQLIKLHGSVDWAREVDTTTIENLTNPWQVAEELIERAADLNITDRYHLVTRYPIGTSDGLICREARQESEIGSIGG